jgi:hypothetical protein
MCFCVTNTNAGQSIAVSYFKRLPLFEAKTVHEISEAEMVFVRAVSCEFVDRSCRSGSKTPNQTETLLEAGRLLQSSSKPRYESSPFTIRAAEVKGWASDFPEAMMCLTSNPFAFK